MPSRLAASLATPLSVTLAAGVVTTVLAATGHLPTADAAATSTAPTSTSVSTGPAAAVRTTPDRPRCGARLATLPAQLRTDLSQARSLPTDQRRPALHALREKALRGGYGTDAQRWSEHRFKHHARVQARQAAHRPKALRAALKHVRSLPADQRPAARQAVHEKVLSGGFGERAQTRAQHRQERREQHRKACAPTTS